MSVILDERDMKIVRYINKCKKSKISSIPTQMNIANHIGLKSSSSVYIRLLKLEIAGLIDRQQCVARSLTVTQAGLEYIRERPYRFNFREE